MQSSIIPQTFDEWRQCIVVDCGLELSERFIEQRISSLQDMSEHYTQQFVRKYGPEHHQRCIRLV